MGPPKPLFGPKIGWEYLGIVDVDNVRGHGWHHPDGLAWCRGADAHEQFVWQNMRRQTFASMVGLMDDPRFKATFERMVELGHGWDNDSKAS